MLTYLTLDGDVLDLTAITAAEAAFLEEAVARWRRQGPWREFARWAEEANPVLEAGRRVTRQVIEHTTYRVARDLEDRLAIAQGALRPEPGDDLERSPVDDALVPVSEVAERQGVSLKSVYKAIERGELVATDSRPTLVSERSLARWKVDEGRQTAGRARPARA